MGHSPLLQGYLIVITLKNFLEYRNWATCFGTEAFSLKQKLNSFLFVAQSVVV